MSTTVRQDPPAASERGATSDHTGEEIDGAPLRDRPPALDDVPDAEGGPDLRALRRRIDEIDEKLLKLLDERCRTARLVGAAKEEAGRPVVDHPREAEVVRRAGRRAREAELDEETVRRIYWGVVELARRHQLSRRRNDGDGAFAEGPEATCAG